MERVQRVIRTIEPHDSAERYAALGVECIHGEARITSPWSVEVTTGEGKSELTTRAIVIATGGRPFVPPIPGIEDVGYVTSDTLWDLRATAAAIAGAGRRADRLRAGAMLGALRLARDTGGDGCRAC